jgi:NTE family protein
MKDTTLGLALGSGAAHGFAHIGVLRALGEMGYKPDVIAGTSVGAIIGAAYLTGEIDNIQALAQQTGLVGILGYIDVTFSRGGLVVCEKMFERFRNPATNIDIAALPKPFGAVATDLGTGREIWLREGDLLTNLRASCAIPGLFPPVQDGRHWLVDGALVNPVPVSLCRALGATFVIGVGLAASRMPLPSAALQTTPDPAKPPAEGAAWLDRVGQMLDEKTRQLSHTLFGERRSTPSAIEALVGSIEVMQSRIMRSRLVGEPPDVLVAPMLGRVGVLEFDRSAEIIELGYEATMALQPMIAQALARA